MFVLAVCFRLLKNLKGSLAKIGINITNMSRIVPSTLMSHVLTKYISVIVSEMCRLETNKKIFVSMPNNTYSVAERKLFPEASYLTRNIITAEIRNNVRQPFNQCLCYYIDVGGGQFI